jgi:hypothetical protein
MRVSRRCLQTAEEGFFFDFQQDDDPDEPHDPRRKSYLEVLHMGP